ncbi:MAG: 4Fe-4S dicluster domain-containing protein [Bacillota bacterium]
MRRLERKDMRAFLDKLASAASLVAPVREDGVVVFRPVSSGEQVVLDYVNPVRSAKELFFPQTEVMFRFLPSPVAGITPVQPDRQTVLFGIRPCDLAALSLLDEVFLGGDYRDACWARRRELTTLVGMACEQPDESSCFCTAFGITPGTADGADIMLYPAGEWLGVEVLTPRGQALLDRALSDGAVALGEIGPPGAASQAGAGGGAGEAGDRLKQEYLKRPVPLGDRLRVGDLAKELDDRFDDPYWEEASRRCLGCGICTYLCPTCHCFLVTDVPKRDDGVRLRCWDSCQFKDFLLMAGGHNPRPTKKERTRQRFMHKLNYFVHRYGRYLCTGCGRCVQHCPVGLDMATVIADLRGVSEHV